MLFVSDNISIPLREFDFSYVRSSGPGGQNVNKVSTKATLAWRVTNSRHLPDDVKARFLARYRNRVSKDGKLIITSQRFRDRGRNVADCLAKLRAMVLEVERAPKARRATRPSRGAKERRLSAKRQNSEKKQSRAKRIRPDD
ncbi:MAG: alternative ribosome rescue aminoacyl-tRNA hydrolase ArfB [Planctomycetota bacterium]